MEHAIKTIAHAWHMSPAQYWHLRVVSALALLPLLAVLYLVVRFLFRRSHS